MQRASSEVLAAFGPRECRGTLYVCTKGRGGARRQIVSGGKRSGPLINYNDVGWGGLVFLLGLLLVIGCEHWALRWDSGRV